MVGFATRRRRAEVVENARGAPYTLVVELRRGNIDWRIGDGIIVNNGCCCTPN